MSKKSFNGKEAVQLIHDFRDEGLPDQEIYFKLREKYFDKLAIAGTILTTVKKEVMVKYKILNNTLLSLLGFIIFIKIIFIISVAIQPENFLFLIISFLLPIINIFFFIIVKNFQVKMYKLLGILSITSFFQSIFNYQNPIEIFVDFILMIAISCLSFYISVKIIPKFSLLKLKKDINGDFIIE